MARVKIAVPAELTEEAKRALHRYEQLAGDHLPREEAYDPVFTPRGDDLLVSVPVTYPEAVLGATIKVPRPSGRTPVKVKLPPNSADGKTMRVRGQGRGGGDLLVTFRIEVPAMVPESAEKALRLYQAATSGHMPRVEAFGHL